MLWKYVSVKPHSLNTPPLNRGITLTEWHICY